MNNSTQVPSKELLPCPFCGSAAAFGKVEKASWDSEPHPDEGGEYIACTNTACAASSMLIFPTMAAARPLLIEKWNKRPAHEPRVDLKRYFQVKPVAVADEPKACRLDFHVGVQTIPIGPEYCEDRDQADWWIDVICKALQNVIAAASTAEQIERLQGALRGIQSCSTCEVCRGVAIRALQGDVG